MKILSNQKIKRLYRSIFLLTLVFTLASAAAVWDFKGAGHYAVFFTAGLGIFIAAAVYRYLKEQDRLMREAAAKIERCICGDLDARIDCDEEGELYRLFHEINTLVSVLNSHAENESKAKNSLRDHISDISHQLKTPLAALNIYLGLIQGDVQEIPEVKELAALSEKELDRIETLVQNLLKIARFDAGTILFEKRLENIAEIMDGIERHFIYQAKQEGKRLIFSGGEVLLPCDSHWIGEAVGNLVKNALDHTKRGDMVWVEWQKLPTIVQIVVRDTGSGIHPEDLYHIFKRFYRSRFAKDTQGIGLGLPLAKAIIEAHNGSVEVESELGRGTVFTVNFLIPTEL